MICKHFVTLLIFSLFTIKIKSQPPIDTLNYLKQFEINKAQYINKPFSYLLNQINQIETKTVNSFTNIYGKDLTAFSDFRFCSLEEQRRKSTVYLIVYWKNPISHSQAMALSKQNHFSFTNDERQFYGDKIIKDIKIYKR
jgi:hypothetical protein